MLLTTAQAAALCSLSRSRFQRLVAEGRIRATPHIGRGYRFTEDEISRFVAIPRQAGWRKGVKRRPRT